MNTKEKNSEQKYSVHVYTDSVSMALICLATKRMHIEYLGLNSVNDFPVKCFPILTPSIHHLGSSSLYLGVNKTHRWKVQHEFYVLVHLFSFCMEDEDTQHLNVIVAGHCESGLSFQSIFLILKKISVRDFVQRFFS